MVQEAGFAMNKIKSWLASEFYRRRYEVAKRQYDVAVGKNYFLPDSDFELFLKKYGPIEAKPFQDYSLQSLQERGKKKTDLLLSLVQMGQPAVLELGAADGFVLKELLARGAKRAVATGIADHLHQDVKRVGVELALKNAEDMSGLESNTFDLIYSWGSFEHILNIKKVTSECIRLLKPGGVIYVEAGPLYYSPWGYHYYSILKVPYIHLLFPAKLLYDYAQTKRGEEAKNYFPWTSGNPFSKYLELVRDLPLDVLVENFWHGYDWFSSGMISKYPEVFKSKRVPFDDFFVDCVRIILKKVKE